MGSKTDLGLGTNDVNWGQRFLEERPDAYLSADLPLGGDRCPLCGRKVLAMKGEALPVCTGCYARYRTDGAAGRVLSAADRAYLQDLMLERFARDNIIDD